MTYLSRHLESEILEAAKHFKIILLLGARQVGKSTLLTHLFPTLRCIVFDPVQDLYNARKDPDLFLDSFPPPLILDEVQYAPELLAALKRRVDKSESKGQYFLTGSQNFSVLKTVSESMAGRVVIYNLENLSLKELAGHGSQGGWLDRYLQDPMVFLQQLPVEHANKPALMEALFKGGVPAVISLPINLIPRYFQSYLQTYVDRDVRIQEDIKQLAEFDRFLGLSASLSAQEINNSQLGREIGISPNTARRWLDLLNFSYQWQEVSSYIGNTIKRLSGKKKGYYKDSGFLCYLLRIDSPESLAIHPKLGAVFKTWVMSNLFQQFSFMKTAPYIYHWRTAAGAEVDVVLEKDGKLYPIEVKCKTNLTSSDLSGLKAFRSTYESSNIAIAMIVYAGSLIYKLDENTIAVPWYCL